MLLRTLVRRFAVPLVIAGFAHGSAFAAPAAYVSFSPGVAREGDPVLISVTVSDGSQIGMTNVALAPGAFVYPSGITNSTTPPQINCSGVTSSLTAVPGANTMSFTASDVPWFGCSFYVYVNIAAPGTYTASLPPGSVTTDQGPASTVDGSVTVTPQLVVTNTNDAGAGSLRAAIDYVNANCVGPYRIAFNIPTAGPAVISPQLQLPTIMCPATIIDGYTQPGSTPNSSPMGCTSPGLQVELSGAACGAGCNGLLGGGITVKGLAIHSFQGSALIVADGAAVSGNILGAGAAGTPTLPNQTGIVVSTGSVQIGGPAAADRNLIVGNTVGIEVDSRATIQNNQLGGQPNCGAGNGNATGIYFFDTASSQDVSGNFVRYGSGNAVSVRQGAVGRVRFSSNSLADNGGIGIDFNIDGPTPNDKGTGVDQDGVQNYPVITAITYDPVGDVTRVDGTLSTKCCSSGTVEVYQNPSARTGITEGEVLRGTAPVDVDGTGVGSWTVTLGGNADNLSATVLYDTCGDGCLQSSEYSPTVTKASLVPLTGASLQLFSSEIDAVIGYGFVDQVFTLFNSGDTDANFGAVPFAVTAGDFSLSPGGTTCGASLAPGNTCSVSIRFQPSAGGASGNTLVVTSDSPTSPDSFDFPAYGLLPLQIAINTPISPAAGSATTATLEVTNPNTSDAPEFTVSQATLTIPAGFVVDVVNTPSCPVAIVGQAPIGSQSFLGKAAAKATALGGLTVAPGVTCTLYDAQLTAPAAPGPYTFAVGVDAVATSAPALWENPTGVSVTVTVVAAGLTVSPTSLNFGSVVVGSSSGPQTVSVSTSSRVPVPIDSITFPAGYVVDSSSCGAAVPVNGCSLAVTFAPTTPGPANGSLVISEGGATYSVSLSGTATALPQLFSATLSPGSLTFPPRALGTRSPPSTITFTNTGTSPLPIRNVTITGDFSLTSTCPITAPLAVGASCSLDVIFSPLITGPRDGLLTVTSDDPASPHTATLSGQGIVVPTGTVSLDPQSLDFDARTTGTTSDPQLIRVTNTGSASIRLAFATSGPFALASVPAGATACRSTLAAGSACQVAVTFTPLFVGGVGGSLVVTSDATNPRVVVSLSGIGVSGPPPRGLSLPGSLDFGAQPVGIRGAAHSLVLANTTAQQLTVSDIALSGDFSMDEGCATIAPRASCAVNLYFKPTARGLRTGRATVSIAGDPLPYLVELGGQGAANPLPVLVVSPLRLGFGNALIGPAGPLATLTLTNPGEVPVLLGNIIPPGDFLLASHCPASLPAGGACTIDVVFYPRLAGLRSFVMEIPSNAVDAPHRVELSGVGCTLPSAARSRIAQLVCVQ